MVRKITATAASRGFAELLDAVEQNGDEYVIERRGKPVARIVSTGPRRVTWGEAIERLRDGPQPDPDFAEDLRKIREAQGELPTDDPWERYSTRRS
jgi:prevent-host-death family protein